MKFTDLIVERENKFLADVKRLFSEHRDLKTYIWGGGTGGHNCKKLCDRMGLAIDGIVTPRAYYSGEADLLCLEDVVAGGGLLALT